MQGAARPPPRLLGRGRNYEEQSEIRPWSRLPPPPHPQSPCLCPQSSTSATCTEGTAKPEAAVSSRATCWTIIDRVSHGPLLLRKKMWVFSHLSPASGAPWGKCHAVKAPACSLTFWPSHECSCEREQGLTEKQHPRWVTPKGPSHTFFHLCAQYRDNEKEEHQVSACIY